MGARNKILLWETRIDIALSRARAENRLVLLEFFDPCEIGCYPMDVTYGDARVVEFVERNMVPLRVACSVQPLSSEFSIRQTPTIITLDEDGKEYQRAEGVLGPDELIPLLLLGCAKCHFGRGRYGETLSTLDMLLTRYPKSTRVPEAIYLRGVCTYKNTLDGQSLRRAYEQLEEEHPSSEWTKKTYPYRYRF